MSRSMIDPVVTTIIPTYNRARELILAVESALAQQYPTDRHEILVVDDGSKDEGATAQAGSQSSSRSPSHFSGMKSAFV